MKKLITVLFLLFITCTCLLEAQEVIHVTPGTGTLNNAIASNGASKIYRLAAGEEYILNDTIEHEGWHLQIIGDEPEAGEKPATLSKNSGAYNLMFDVRGDITLKNIYIMNVDQAGHVGESFLRNRAYEGTITIDNCILEPASTGSCIIASGGLDKIYFTNNLVVNMGRLDRANDGHFFLTGSSSSGAGLDTLYVENNTFVSMGTNMHAGGHDQFEDNFILWNHNSWVNQKSQFNWTLYENELYFTNNLLFNAQTQPWAFNWDVMPGYDKDYRLFGIIYGDTIPGETLPSERISYINYNTHYRLPGFYALVNEINMLDDMDSLSDVYLQPLVWHPDDFPGNLRSRETELFANDLAFPHWTYDYSLNWKDEDPLWRDPRIYDYADSMLQWTIPVTYMHALGLNEDDPRVGPVEEWPNWHWNPDGEPLDNKAWPLFDGRYTSTVMLQASLEGLPLGDLNWFPEKKQIWMDHRQEIFTHIKTGETERIDLSGIENRVEMRTGFSRIFPNPVYSEASIEYSLTESASVDILIYNSTGQQLKVLLSAKMPSGSHHLTFSREPYPDGLYFLVIRAGNRQESHKLILTGM